MSSVVPPTNDLQKLIISSNMSPPPPPPPPPSQGGGGASSKIPTSSQHDASPLRAHVSEFIPRQKPASLEEILGSLSVKKREKFREGTEFVVAKGSVVDFRGEAVVNAANTRCIGGGGVDGAITDKGGPTLMQARMGLPILDDKQTRCHVGDAKMTTGGDLAAKYCIHAVGPDFRNCASSSEGEELLTKTYSRVMSIGVSENIESIGFPLISAGDCNNWNLILMLASLFIKTISLRSHVITNSSLFSPFSTFFPMSFPFTRHLQGPAAFREYSTNCCRYCDYEFICLLETSCFFCICP